MNLALAGLLAASVALAGNVGWRRDGTGTYPSTTLPETWSDTSGVLWSTDVGAQSNASPVVAAGKVCVLAEPAAVVCLDAASGAVVWRASLGVLDVLPAAEVATLRPRLERAPKVQEELRALQARYAQLRRDARAGTAGLADIEAAVADMGRLTAELKELSPHLPPPANDEIGWTSPTPITDGRRLYAFAANGVVAAFDLATGKRAWGRWLGEHTGRLRGYEGHPTASPGLVSGVLVVGHNTLVGLDIATGVTRWEVGPYEDFGAPATAVIGGIGVVLTPSGRLVRASDGLVMQEGLGDLFYSGPVVVGTRAWFVGTTSDMPAGRWPTHALSWDLAASGDKVVATKRWAVQLTTRERIYASPLVWGNRLITVAIDGTLLELDATTGKEVRSVKLTLPEHAQLWASPMVVGESLRLFSDKGHLITLGPDLSLRSASRVEPGLGQPHFEGGRAYVRGERRVWAIGR